MRTIKIVLQYLGTHYHGWQVQPQGPTIQGVLEEILHKLLHKKTTLFGAGRTDAGVHALAQVAHFHTDHPLDLETMERALNANLPDDIAVLSVEEESSDFHSQHRALAKTYSYFVLNSATKIPILHRFTWRVFGPLELDDMHLCLEMLVGEHDFAAFKAADATAKTSVRRLPAVGLQKLTLRDFSASLAGGFGLTGMIGPLGEEDTFHPEEGGPSILAFHFKGSGFLKHMVRNIMGTVMGVGRGNLGVDDFRKIFESRDRTQAGITAPAQGLFLVKIDYP